jgi:hypothetical protein
VVSLAELRDPVPPMEDVKQAVIAAFGDVFGCEMIVKSAFPV